MKRISMLMLGLCALSWVGGCCHPYYSRCADYDDSCYGHQHNRFGHRKHKRHGKDAACSVDGCQDDDSCGDCCDSCCGTDGSGYPASGVQMPMSSGVSFGQSMPMGTGNCATGNCGGGMPSGGGCASGNCGGSGSMENTYGGFPIDPSQGWTISPSSSSPTILNEPIPAPPSSNSSAPPAPPANQSSVPIPTPIPTPVSSAR